MEGMGSSYVGHCSFSLVGLWSNKREAFLCCSLYVQRTGDGCDEGGHVRLVETWRTLGHKLPPPQAAYWFRDEGLSANEAAEIGASRKVGTLFGRSCSGRHRCNFIQREAKVTVIMPSSVEEQCSPSLCCTEVCAS